LSLEDDNAQVKLPRSASAELIAQVLHSGDVTSRVGLRELRQDASELVRRVEAGEEIDITVSGRLAARLVPPRPRRWHTWSDITSLFDGPTDPDWDHDRDRIDQSIDDPWISG
jgi:prevent-host-death family protein